MVILRTRLVKIFLEKQMCVVRKEKQQTLQASSSSRQQFQRKPFLNKTESQNVNQTHTGEIKTVGTIVSLAENKSAQEQDTSRESPMKKEDGEHQLVIVSFTEKKECSGKLHGGSSVTEKPPDLAFQDALTSNEEDILSGTLKDIYDRSTMNSFQQKKKEVEIVCFIKPPAIVLENLKCNTLNDTRSLVVDDSEELVRNVISMECYDYEKPLFPINIAIPFTSCFRGNYQEIMVKVTDTNFQSNYLTPISLQGSGNHKESFAEVKIYHLGVFSLLSCLKKETFTVPKVGLLQKLNVDSQISFCYHSETFNSLAPRQLKIQPIEPSISALKARHYMYHSVISMSALVHVQHPSSQPFNSSVTITLPCPPIPDNKRQGVETEDARALSATGKRVAAAYHPQAASPSVRKSVDNLSDTLKLLGRRNEEGVFDDVIIQNAQNGLVSFELNEHLESFVVICLAPFLLENRYLLLFAQALEEALRSTTASLNVILYQKRENPYKIVVLLSASRELTNELQNLYEEGYIGPPEPTQHFPLRQGEQIHFRFGGNISASGNGGFRKVYRLIFHSRQPRLELQIRERDEFGHHSSPHYKGTAVFYKITREMIPKKWEQTLPYDEYQLQSPLCKLALTLPKHEKLIHSPQRTKRFFSDSSEALWDKLLFWLAQEIAEDNISLFALCLPVRRSMFQIVRLKGPDNLTHQMYELLCCCKKTLPKSADKQQISSQYLQKSGRSDLSEELHLKWQNKLFT
ncbi:LOW QUALITY PROTEIN: death domain-containing protein 1 [Passerculus sandwichensis]